MCTCSALWLNNAQHMELYTVDSVCYHKIFDFLKMYCFFLHVSALTDYLQPFTPHCKYSAIIL